MKLLVFAHTPPPHHGQSYMVKLMLEGFGGDHRKKSPPEPPNDFGIECYHVNARFSKALEDVGEFQGAKLFLIVFYCLQAIWCRFRYGVENFYYVPAPGKKVALYRDWLVMLICRPFFKRVILHWHAAGLAKWLETSVQMRTRATTYRLFKPVTLSLVLSRQNLADGEKFLSDRVCVVNNGIADDCSNFESTILPRRRARAAERVWLLRGEAPKADDSRNADDDPRMVKILFLAHCTRVKGLFDALEGVRLAGEHLHKINSPLRLSLLVAGDFLNSQEQSEFSQYLERHPNEKSPNVAVTYLGFLGGEAKRRAFIDSDIFCFPTYYHAESFGLVLVEAMMYGLPIITTRWRSIPELLPGQYPGLVDIQAPAKIADAIIQFAGSTHDWPTELRQLFLKRFTLQQHFAALATAIHSIE